MVNRDNIGGVIIGGLAALQAIRALRSPDVDDATLIQRATDELLAQVPDATVISSEVQPLPAQLKGIARTAKIVTVRADIATDGTLTSVYTIHEANGRIVQILPDDPIALAQFGIIPHELPIEAAFSWRATGGTTIHFKDESEGTVTDYEWSFGDGAFSAEADPPHIYATPGSYDVTLTVTGPAGTDTLTEAVVVPSPTPPGPIGPPVLTLAQYVAQMTVNGKALAFIGADGVGKFTRHARGGPIFFASDEASLKAAWSTPGPVNIIPVVQRISMARVRDIYGAKALHGHLAPGRSLLLTNPPDPQNPGFSTSGAPVLQLGTNPSRSSTAPRPATQFMVRHVTCRPLPASHLTCCQDVLEIGDATDVIVDHVSVAYGTDTAMAINGADRVTVQHSLIALGLERSTHGERSPRVAIRHSMGWHYSRGTKRVDGHRNLLAFSRSRNPRIARGDVEWVNNIHHGNTTTAINAKSTQGAINLLVDGNWLNEHFQLDASLVKASEAPIKDSTGAVIGRRPVTVYLGINRVPPGFEVMTQGLALVVPAPPFTRAVSDVWTPDRAYATLIEGGDVGANLGGHDRLDTMILDATLNKAPPVLHPVQAVLNGTPVQTSPLTDSQGRARTWIDHPSEVGGIPPDPPVPSDDPSLRVDSDGDGMPDIFEQFMADTYGAPIGPNGGPGDAQMVIPNTGHLEGGPLTYFGYYSDVVALAATWG